ncbi:MAG: hypothetical protein CMJ18_15775 [Phycisphaeraceae bacterium]|nr:hypothetical protein [Phycisphaeraceae bacterium]
MKVCDFSSSFYSWRIDKRKRAPVTTTSDQPFTVNLARTPVECRCELTTRRGVTTEYVLGAACKTERVNVTQDIWTQPNADYAPVGSERDYLRIKSWDRNDKGVMLHPPTLGVQSERQVGDAFEDYDGHEISLSRREGRILESAEQVIEAVEMNRCLVSRTKFMTADGHEVLLEYPVKAINVSRVDGYYQVDTGPVLFPEAPVDVDRPIRCWHLAYVAHNAPDWTEFIVNVPTSIADEISVNHYSRAVRVDAANVIYEVADIQV